MGFIVLICLLTVIAGAVFLFGPPLFVDEKDVDKEAGQWAIRIITGIVYLVLAVPTVLGFAWQPIGAGHEGVVYNIGGDIVSSRHAGDNWNKPWLTTKVISVQRATYQPETRCSNGHERCLDTFSKDNQDVFMAVTLNYHIDPENVQTLLRTNPNYIDRTIRPRVNQFVKDETVKYGSTEIAAHREDIRKAVTERLTAELAAAGIGAEDFFIDNLDFQTGFKEAIEAKVRAEQDAITEQNKVQISIAQANQKREAAKGDAAALEETARGQANANNLLNASLTPALIQFTAIQKLSDKISIMLLPAGSNFLIDPTKLAPAAQ